MRVKYSLTANNYWYLAPRHEGDMALTAIGMVNSGENRLMDYLG